MKVKAIEQVMLVFVATLCSCQCCVAREKVNIHSPYVQAWPPRNLSGTLLLVKINARGLPIGVVLNGTNERSSRAIFVLNRKWNDKMWRCLVSVQLAYNTHFTLGISNGKLVVKKTGQDVSKAHWFVERNIHLSTKHYQELCQSQRKLSPCLTVKADGRLVMKTPTDATYRVSLFHFLPIRNSYTIN